MIRKNNLSEINAKEARGWTGHGFGDLLYTEFLEALSDAELRHLEGILETEQPRGVLLKFVRQEIELRGFTN